ncbi:unnamed protein product [Clavelina lepadiformis]|uniref:Uncharacterized protein n=1 Tax=Clavelina lepadiformis TaxID=159417 RepID=A0ABP0G6G5_CLALP
MLAILHNFVNSCHAIYSGDSDDKLLKMSYLQDMQNNFSILSQGHAQVALSPLALAIILPVIWLFACLSHLGLIDLENFLFGFCGDSLLDLPQNLIHPPTQRHSVQFSSENPFLLDVQFNPLSHFPETKTVKLPSF